MSKIVGVTGAAGFIGRNVVANLTRVDGYTVRECGRATFADDASLDAFVAGCDVIVHLAGVNRGTDDEIARVNPELAQKLVASAERTGTVPHFLYSSSTQETAENVYGRAKREAGEILATWAAAAGGSLTKLVIPNVYGAGAKPFYNSVVATFCHQLATGETPEIHVDKSVEFIYIKELVDAICGHVASPLPGCQTIGVEGSAELTVRELLETLTSFRDSYFGDGVVPDLSDRTRQHLYATFLSYVSTDDLRHCPPLHTDDRGSLVEVIKLSSGGQVFFSTTKPGVIRGNHFHTRKIEWFCVLKGEAIIRLRPIGGETIREFRVSGDKPQFVSIPVLHTHHIENVGDEELLTVFWCNEIFDASDADTYFEKVA